MNQSTFILNDKPLEINNITYDQGLLSIKTSNNYVLNIDLKFDITTLDNDVRENISNRISIDQNFITEKYGYVIDIGKDVFLTKSNDNYLLEIDNPNVDILIPPYDIINNKRLELNSSYDEIEIHQLNVKIYFNL